MTWTRILALAVFILEAVLSHTPGDRSGEESKALSRLTGISESALRRAAHVILFAGMSLTASLGFGWAGAVAVAAWAFLDELTKIPISGRHFSCFDVGLNLIGTAIGAGVAIAVQMMMHRL